MYAYDLAPGYVIPQSGTIASVRFRDDIVMVTLTNGKKRFFYEDNRVEVEETSE
jgi:hypothetical protein